MGGYALGRPHEASEGAGSLSGGFLYSSSSVNPKTPCSAQQKVLLRNPHLLRMERKRRRKMSHINRWIAAIAVFFNLFIGACATTPPQESTDTKCSPDGTECERLIAQYHNMVFFTGKPFYYVSPDSKRVAYLSRTGNKLSVLVD
jgi:hypothetical protein